MHSVMASNRKLGIIGGMSSRAGALLFKKIIDASPALTDQEFIEIILHNNSAVPDRTRAIVRGEESPANGILRSIKLFNKNQVDLVVRACYLILTRWTSLSRRLSGNVITLLNLWNSKLIKA